MLVLGAAVVFLALWVKGLKADVENRDLTIADQVKTIADKDKANKDLSTANTILTTQIITERNATAERSAKVKELEEELKGKEGKYGKATKDDACANTRAPDDVLSVMQ